MDIFEILEEDQPDKLTEGIWDKISQRGTDFFSDLPFLDDPQFLKLNPVQQRLLLAYSLRGVYGFRLSDAYIFASGRRRGDVTQQSAAKSARGILNSPRMQPFINKLEILQIENLGFTTNKIIQAEMEIAYSDLTEYLDEDGCFNGNLKDMPQNLRRAIKEIEIIEHQDRQGNPVKKYKLKLWDKGASLQRMQKIKGMHVDVAETTSKTVNISGEMSSVDAAKAYQDMMRDEG